MSRTTEEYLAYHQDDEAESPPFLQVGHTIFREVYPDDLIEFDLYKSLEDYRRRFGDDGLMKKIEEYLQEKGLY